MYKEQILHLERKGFINDIHTIILRSVVWKAYRLKSRQSSTRLLSFYFIHFSIELYLFDTMYFLAVKYVPQLIKLIKSFVIA